MIGKQTRSGRQGQLIKMNLAEEEVSFNDSESELIDEEEIITSRKRQRRV